MKNWFITGASRGFGRVWAEAALRRGDRVAVTSRNKMDLQSFSEEFGKSAVPLELDVTDAAQVKSAVTEAHGQLGRLDVVLNNAGYPLVGAVEEVTEEQVREQFDTNYLGTFRVIQAVLPFLRQQGSGHLLGTSSTVGLTSLPLIGSYCASKWAFEALHEALAAEVKQFGIKVSLIEPGAYATEFGQKNQAGMAAPMEPYTQLRTQVFGSMMTMERGDPQASAEAVLKLVDAEQPPLRLILGSEGVPMMHTVYADRLKQWDQWKAVSEAAQTAR